MSVIAHRVLAAAAAPVFVIAVVGFALGDRWSGLRLPCGLAALIAAACLVAGVLPSDRSPDADTGT